MRKISRHAEWLNLVERSGPFLAGSVLDRLFPQGLDAVETPRRKLLRAAYDEWTDAVYEDDPQVEELHREWIRLVFTEILDFDNTVLFPTEGDESAFTYISHEHTGSFAPDFTVRANRKEKPLLLVSIQPPGTDLEKVRPGDGWPASILERMTLLCRSVEVRLGLVTEGERWVLVNAPVGSTSSHTSWYARLWFQEPVTLKAFQSLLGVRRWFGPEEETLPAMLEESLQHHEEVTDTLGEQVRRAVEVLVQCLDKADQDRNRELLRDVPPVELYEAGLTVMMRLVFVLCAEERGLLLLGDPTYDQHYAITTMRGQLAEEADRYGPEVLERRHDAWSRLLSVFRAVYGGVEQETLRMPAMGGSLFDPDRFPFLEGRAKRTHWQDTTAKPLPIDNRTVLILLNALQVLEQRGGALLLSYKALDVEQIGHVYEGLLEHTVQRLPKVTLGLEGSKKAKNSNLSLDEMESARSKGEKDIVDLVKYAAYRSDSAIKNALKKDMDDETFGKVIAACGGDMELANRIRPFAHLLRTDAWGDFIVYRANSFAVTLGADRRETGTHYTPKSLTESIVETTLEPVAYVGPTEGKPREEWKLKSSGELLELKICDPAMGSGAFLVQVCRWLSERLVEAWGKEMADGKFITVDGVALDASDGSEPMPNSLDERLLIARRLVAEKCLYGVDLNPLAVELAKLSIWLVTLAKGRPFGFLDHNLRYGDSLLGIHRLDQLNDFSLMPGKPNRQIKTVEPIIKKAVIEAIKLRKKLRETPIRDIYDIQAMRQLDKEARKKLENIDLVGDAMIGEVLRSGGKVDVLEASLNTLSALSSEFIQGDNDCGRKILEKAQQTLSTDLSSIKQPRKPLHWALEFPEVFKRENPGFDAILGNPPFMFGKNITKHQGKKYNAYLKSQNPDADSNVDLCAHFFVRSFDLLRLKGCFCLLSTSSISEGATRKASLERIYKSNGTIFNAKSKVKWPGKANVYISSVGVYRGNWCGTKWLDEKRKEHISPLLTSDESWEVSQLVANTNIAYVGVIPNGKGLFLEEMEYKELVSKDNANSDVLYPYITGKDLNARPGKSKRYIINFWDWPLQRAKKYPDVLKIVEERVKPHRNTLSDIKTKVRENWWLYEAAAKNLFHAIGNSSFFEKKPLEKPNSLEQAIAIARISKTGAFTFVSTDSVFAAEVVVIASDSKELFAVLQSSIHISFAWNYAGKMKVDLRYSPTLCFEPFPFPLNTTDLEKVGELYYNDRKQLLDLYNIGLTELYQKIHSPESNYKEIIVFREVIRRLDECVLHAYRWEDLSLNHDFHQVAYLPGSDNIRFTISEEARGEIIQRLSTLNRQRYNEEVRRGLLDKKNKPLSAKYKKKEIASNGDHPKLFGKDVQ